MQNRELRQSQIITTFGPGSIVDYGGESFMISVADNWEFPGGDALQSHIITDEKRLLSRLNCTELRTPPLPDENNKKTGAVTSVRFPDWLYCKKCGKFQPYRQWKIDWMRAIGSAPSNREVYGKPLRDFLRDRFDVPECDHCYNKIRTSKDIAWERVPRVAKLIPTRFIVACRKGHVSDFPWVEWCHEGPGATAKGGQACRHGVLKYEAGGGSGGLESIKITCQQCGRSNTLQGCFQAGALKDIAVCSGQSPWIDWAQEICEEPLKTLQRGGSNLYYPRHYSSITIPPESTEKQQQLCRLLDFRVIKQEFEERRNQQPAADDFDDEGAGIDVLSPEEIFEELIGGYPGNLKKIAAFLGNGKDFETAKKTVKAVLIGTETEIHAIDDEDHYRLDEYKYMSEGCGENSQDCLLYVEPASSNDPLFAKFNQVFRLREVLALTGFSRIVPANESYEHGNDNFLKALPAPVVRKSCRWYPAAKGFGEGIFIQFNEEELKSWNQDQKERYRLMHTFAHLVMRRLSFDAGYTLAALKERIYCLQEAVEVGDQAGSMCGVLIYTVSTDPAGTLGGLVRLGTEERILPIIKAAVRDAQFCSGDPLCWETPLGNNNTAACYACTFLPETSCENRNSMLNRKLLVDPEYGYFKGWL